jgi:hypothetical protein
MPEHCSLAPGHASRLALVSLMVVPAQMQHAMDEQPDQLAINVLLVLTGLADGLRQGNDNITQ